MDVFTGAPTFPYLPTLLRLALTLAFGLFVGLERERRGKEAGLRTFGFAALLGGLGGLLGESYALLGLGLLGILIVFLNWATLREGEGLESSTRSYRKLRSMPGGLVEPRGAWLTVILIAAIGFVNDITPPATTVATSPQPTPAPASPGSDQPATSHPPGPTAARLRTRHR